MQFSMAVYNFDQSASRNDSINQAIQRTFLLRFSTECMRVSSTNNSTKSRTIQVNVEERLLTGIVMWSLNCRTSMQAVARMFDTDFFLGNANMRAFLTAKLERERGNYESLYGVYLIEISHQMTITTSARLTQFHDHGHSLVGRDSPLFLRVELGSNVHSFELRRLDSEQHNLSLKSLSISHNVNKKISIW